MKKIISFLMLFGLVGFPTQAFASEAEQTTTVRTTINATKAPELDDLITKEKKKQREKNDYTEESWNKYQDALKEAEEVLNNSPYDEEKVNAALANLQQAINGLVLKKTAGGGSNITSGSTSGTKSGTTNTPSKTTSGTAAKSYPKSGMTTGIGLAGIGILLVAGAVVGWRKRR